ncbi:MAG: hypothetical protein C0478_02925 [Planctomyces sp.]|nr:hypothetical protein [Planctomyces sp.]
MTHLIRLALCSLVLGGFSTTMLAGCGGGTPVAIKTAEESAKVQKEAEEMAAKAAEAHSAGKKK